MLRHPPLSRRAPVPNSGRMALTPVESAETAPIHGIRPELVPRSPFTTPQITRRNPRNPGFRAFASRFSGVMNAQIGRASEPGTGAAATRVLDPWSDEASSKPGMFRVVLVAR